MKRVKRIKNSISLLLIAMLIISAPQAVFAAPELSADASANETIVDISGMDGKTAAEDELLILVEEGTTKSEASAIAEDAGATLDNISTLDNGKRMAKISLNDAGDAQSVAEQMASENAVLIIQPNYIYHLEDENAGDATVKSAETPAEEMPEANSGDTDPEETAEPSDSSSENAEGAASKEGTDGSDAETPEEAESTEVIDDQSEIKADSASQDYTSAQWYLDNEYTGAMNARAAWEKLSANGSNVVVAVIDTGVKLDHPDLKDNIIADKCVTFNNGSKGGFTDWDGSDDEQGHGTHVCGLIAAVAGNGIGIDGIANNRAKIIAIDASMPGTKSFKSQDIVRAINYAIKDCDGVKIINLSIGGLYRDYIQEESIELAEANGILCVCAAGNEKTDVSVSPGDSAPAISVIAHDDSGNRGAFSNYGLKKDVSAPGVGIISTYIDSNGYHVFKGTSMAAPLVTGLAALIKSENSSLNQQEIKNYIYTSSGSESFSVNKGFGLVNAYNAIVNVKKAVANPNKIVLNSNSLSLCPGESFPLEYAVYPAAASTYADTTTFSSADRGVAEVDQHGIVTAKKAGTTTITAKCGNATVKCNVAVDDIEYKKITYQYSGSGSFKTTDHKLLQNEIYNGATFYYESIVNGYQIDLPICERPVAITAYSNTIFPTVKVFGPDGTEQELDVKTSLGTDEYMTTSYLDVEKAGTYKLQVLGELVGQEPDKSGGFPYKLYVDGLNNVELASVYNVSSRTYTGRAQTQNPIVICGGQQLENGTDYTLTYRNNVNAGTAVMTINGIGNYYGTKEVKFSIGKISNRLYVKGKTYKIKRSKLKKKARSVAVGKVMAISGANGRLTYARVSGSKKLKINASTGAVTIKKKTKKGKYKMTVAVTASGDTNHYGATRYVTIVVRVK